MAKLEQMPSKDVIDAYHGVLDFYRWCDLVIVRSWPRWTLANRSPAVEAAQQPFAYVNQVASTLPANVVETWKEMAGTGGLTWKDWLNRAYLSGTYLPKEHPKEWEANTKMDLVLLNGWSNILSIGPLSSDVPWSDIDVSSYVSSNAVAAIIVGSLRDYSPVPGWLYYLYARKKGDTGSKLLTIAIGPTSGYIRRQNEAIVGLDADKLFQYNLNIPTAATQVYLYLYIVGYWKES